MKTSKLALIGGAVAILGCLSLAFTAPAGADTGYPGTTTVTTPPGPSSPGGTSPGGTSTGPCAATVIIPSGNTTVVVLTGCAPSSTFSITIAGVATGITVNSDAAGNITLTNVVTGDPYLSVNGSKPILTKYGTDLASSNTVTLTNASGGPGGTENVIIPNIVTAALGSSSGSGGTLAFTGADLLALIVGGLFLLAMGTLLVVFTRRRANRQQLA
jgi:hypothetical protein